MLPSAFRRFRRNWCTVMQIPLSSNGYPKYGGRCGGGQASPAAEVTVEPGDGNQRPFQIL
jgi:hypothetical protein